MKFSTTSLDVLVEQVKDYLTDHLLPSKREPSLHSENEILNALTIREMSKNDFYKHFSNNMREKELTLALKNLCEQGLIIASRRRTKGRPKTVYCRIFGDDTSED